MKFTQSTIVVSACWVLASLSALASSEELFQLRKPESHISNRRVQDDEGSGIGGWFSDVWDGITGGDEETEDSTESIEEVGDITGEEEEEESGGIGQWFEDTWDGITGGDDEEEEDSTIGEAVDSIADGITGEEEEEEEESGGVGQWVQDTWRGITGQESESEDTIGETIDNVVNDNTDQNDNPETAGEWVDNTINSFRDDSGGSATRGASLALATLLLVVVAQVW